MSAGLMARTEACWNGSVPDWIHALAAACERQTQRQVAGRIGYSHTVVSQVLRNNYPRSAVKIEVAVRGAFMAGTVECPVLGEIGSHACVAHQNRKDTALGANPDHVRVFRACRAGCPHYFKKRVPDDAA